MSSRVAGEVGFIETLGKHFARAFALLAVLCLRDGEAYEAFVVRHVLHAVCVLFAIPVLLCASSGAETSSAVRGIDLDAADCYRVHDLDFQRGEVRFFLSDGFLIFSKPVKGAPIAAVFSATENSGDAEVILLPPNRDERRVLNARTGAPNLDEHVREAAFFFADDLASELKAKMRGNEFTHADPARGTVMAEHYGAMMRNLAPRFDARLCLDLLNAPHQPDGYFVALIGGVNSGNFYLLYDAREPEQIQAGQEKANGQGYDLWTSYTPRSFQNRKLPRDFEAGQYRMDARIDSGLHMAVQTTATVRIGARDIDALSFDLSKQMRIEAVEVDGEKADVVESASGSARERDADDRMFVVVPSKRLSAQSEHTLQITHQGDVITAGPHQVYYVGSRGRWYPHRSLEFAPFDLKFRFPKNLDMVAPGEAVMDLVDGNERVMERRSEVPLPMAGFNLGNYARTTVKRGHFTVEVCADRDVPEADSLGAALPEPARVRVGAPLRRPSGEQERHADPAERRAAIANDIADAMEFFAHRFGAPPLSKLIVSPIPGRFGQGFGGLIYLSTMAYMSPSGTAFSAMNSEQRLFFTELMHAHETAHQWWGNLVLTASYHDEWITEALANYSAMLYLEKKMGGRVVESMLESYREGLLDKNSAGVAVEDAGPVTQGRRIELDGKPNAWVSIVYGKGAWIMRMLHARMGDAAFWKMLEQLRQRYERKNITTEQFRVLCAEFMPAGESDRSLEGFFDQWVWGTGIPALKLTSSVKPSGSGLRVSGSLAQSGVPDDFSADFPVEVQLRGKTLTHWVRSSSEPVSFSVPVNSSPLHVRLDPANRFLKK